MSIYTYKCLPILLLFLVLPGLQPLFAEYSNPVLKVLLFSTNSNVTLGDRSGMTFEGNNGKIRFQKRLYIKKINKNDLNLNHRWAHHGSLWVKGNSNLEVWSEEGIRKRKYKGIIEIKPTIKGLHVINHILTEEYLEGVLNAEISTKWNIEVVKAQSIIARTFALFKRNERSNLSWHITSGLRDQVYQGMNVSDYRGNQAILATKGIVVTYNGRLAQTFYHSNCGGMTEDPAYLWNFSYPYLSIKEVPFGQDDPKFFWNTYLPDQDLQHVLMKAGISIGKVKEVIISEKTRSDRAYKMIFRGETGSGTLLAADFRKYFGYTQFQSLLFDVIRTPKGFKFKGRGNGHGVGMCQWAAKEMADNGFTYDEILFFFYDNINLQSYSRG
ncbi:MAG: SpoIID/LytB domain-containing protein [Proteobacteria bacterium]|nr:SpoIID/LytB domain-containing protein [Pseudomonadota bacterium]